MNYGLCCLFHQEPIKFKTYTFKNVETLKNNSQLDVAINKILNIWDYNIISLQRAIDYCAVNEIAAYRIGSDILPQLHRIVGDFIDTHTFNQYLEKLRGIDKKNIILSFHPDMHVALSSPHVHVIENAFRDLEDHWLIADSLACDEINIHIGGVYGDKPSAMSRFIHNIGLLDAKRRSSLTIENDELNYDIYDVLNACDSLGVRATFDIHHQRCFDLGQTNETDLLHAFELSKQTWNEYDYHRVHLSSPLNSYTTVSKSRAHADIVHESDVPVWLFESNAIVDIEAKHKEQAIKHLQSCFK